MALLTHGHTGDTAFPVSDLGPPPPDGARSYRQYTRAALDTIPQLATLPPREREAMLAVSAVLPCRTNRYVVEELIDWSDVPADPIYQLVFPQREMLSPQDLDRMLHLVRANAPEREIRATASEIQRTRPRVVRTAPRCLSARAPGGDQRPGHRR